ncbi:MAG: hypothetical protein H6974_05100 [Gammaproteobacteria bacterium]|nr:hypothetical protein [Gammaproteobacteria bacterium]MCP5196157.1 hypothetical protein [Gammaproteobacteria bacterium]
MPKIFTRRIAGVSSIERLSMSSGQIVVLAVAPALVSSLATLVVGWYGSATIREALASLSEGFFHQA